MAHELMDDARERMKAGVEHLAKEIRGIRSGQATPALVENIKADYYGSMMPISQLAQIQIPEPRQIAIKPFDAGALGAIEKAIQKSDIGIHPQSDGKLLRLAVPMLSEDQRKKLSSRLKEMGETARVALRNTRRDVNKKIDGAKSDSELTEDEAKKLKDDVQDLLKKQEGEIDTILAAKTKEIMEE